MSGNPGDPLYATYAAIVPGSQVPAVGETREPVGWNVYHGNGDSWTFREFVPNEPVLAAEAGKMAGEIERRLEDGTL